MKREPGAEGRTKACDRLSGPSGLQNLTRVFVQPIPLYVPCSLQRWGAGQPQCRAGAGRREGGGVVLSRKGGSMAEPAAVTDTHPLLFHATGSKRLGKRAAAHFQACEQQQAITYVPVAVIWEAGLLARVGRVDLRRSLREFFADLFSNPAYQPLDLTPEQVYLADEERPNNDPFDALICAAARSLELPLLSRDSDIHESGLVKVLW